MDLWRTNMRKWADFQWMSIIQGMCHLQLLCWCRFDRRIEYKLLVVYNLGVSEIQILEYISGSHCISTTQPKRIEFELKMNRGITKISVKRPVITFKTWIPLRNYFDFTYLIQIYRCLWELHSSGYWMLLNSGWTCFYVLHFTDVLSIFAYRMLIRRKYGNYVLSAQKFRIL